MDAIQILLVEDDEVFASVIGRVLKRKGYSVTFATSAEQALERVKELSFDLAILDLNLGKQTSLGLIAPLKQQFPTIRILILTGYASIATAVEAIKLGANNYLAKPADADEILSALLENENNAETDSVDSPALETMSVRRLEWEHIQKVLQENAGNISATARQLKMHRRTLQRKLQKRPVKK